ncbi:MAG: DNA-binding response regulator [Betaproteobacteria bacterium HGW-Betaproteobacteria-21]|nr:MAG: DNA-binding response regulator [Betaproteobacteria bacterium HGW-Betaproteobacteria-21]
MRVLVVEDEASLRRSVVVALAEVGASVSEAADGREGLYLAQEYPFDVAVIDLGLPGLPGLDLIRSLRAHGSRLPILILTARGRWQEKVEGLESGADDYLVKPFEMPELIARVRALWRRTAGAASTVVTVGPYRIDLDALQVRCEERAVELTAFEFRVLDYLVRKRDRVVSKQELGDYLYPQDEERDSNVLEVLIGRLRRKLDPAGQWAPIETLRGRGYRFAPRLP